jgi:hypothetical protein
MIDLSAHIRMAYVFVLSVNLVFLITLTGCLGPLPVKMDVPNYSVGPVSSPNFQDMVLNSIPEDMGEVRVFGKASWLGFRKDDGPLMFVNPYFKGVAVLTDTDILLLLWSEVEQRYQILKQVAYSNIRYRPSTGRGSLHLHLMESEFSFGEIDYRPAGTTYLSFTNNKGAFTVRENHKRAHALFQEKVEKYIVEIPSPNSIDGEY